MVSVAPLGAEGPDSTDPTGAERCQEGGEADPDRAPVLDWGRRGSVGSLRGHWGARAGMGAQPLLHLVPSRWLSVVGFLLGRHHTPRTREGFRLPLNHTKMI